MTGLEKIIQEIQAEAAREAEAIQVAGKAEANDILAAAKEQSDAVVQRIEADSAKAVEDARRAGDSALALQRRQRTLQQKQALLAETLDKALAALYDLPDKEYFDLLVRLAAKNAAEGDGEMLLSQKDLARMPKDFEAQVNKALPTVAKLTVSAAPRALDGGFVLKYGDIEENNSFKAIFDASAEEMADSIRGVLFGDA